jgi:hypothetical protein
MKKSLILFCLFGMLFPYSRAQEIISNSGGYFENSNGSISMTIGEPIIETFSNGTNILTQGFQQSRLSAVSIFELEDSGISISIAPNPSSGYLRMNVNLYKDLNYQLFDLNGKMIKEGNLYSNETDLSFSDCVDAVYILKISRYGKIIQTFQIIKQP